MEKKTKATAKVKVGRLPEPVLPTTHPVHIGDFELYHRLHGIPVTHSTWDPTKITHATDKTEEMESETTE